MDVQASKPQPKSHHNQKEKMVLWATSYISTRWTVLDLPCKITTTIILLHIFQRGSACLWQYVYS